MGHNDPLRRYELAQRIARLRAERELAAVPVGSHVTAPSGRDVPVPPDQSPPAGNPPASTVQPAAQAAAHVAAQPPPPVVAEDWWHDHGPTLRALEAFGGEDGWVLAWVLHERTGFPLAVLHQRDPGSRWRTWTPRQVVLDLLNDRFLDVTGEHTGPELGAWYAGSPGLHHRVSPLPPGTDLRHLRDFMTHRPGRETVDWADELVVAPPEAVHHVAAGLLARHGLVWQD